MKWHQTINSVATILTIATAIIGFFDLKEDSAQRELKIKNELDSIVQVMESREVRLLQQLEEVKEQKAIDSAEYYRISNITEQQIKRLQNEIIPLKRRVRDIGVLPEL